jgi:hypothetical protein
MADLELTYESADDVPEGLRDYYKADGDGVFRPSVAGGGFAEDVKGLKSTNRAVRSERDEHRRAATRLKEENAALQAQLDEAKKGGGSKPGKGAEDFAAREQALLAKHQAEVQKLAEERDGAFGQLASTMAKAAIMSGLPEGMKANVGATILRGVVRSVRGEDGKFQTKVFESADSDTPRMTLKPNSTSDMDVEEFFSDVFPKEFADYVPGTGSSGGGAGGSDESRSAPAGAHTISETDARDAQKFRAAEAKAEKAGADLAIVGD